MNRKDFIKVLKTCTIFVILIMITLFSYAYIKVNKVVAELPNLNTKQIYAHASTKVYDQNHHLLLEIGVERRDIVSYDEISPYMIDALISIEDERFFEHHGIDYKRILAALIDNLKSYRFKEGASTLTQQLIKLSYLSNEKTIDRKIKEMFLSVELENELSKEKIIEAYLNRVLFGGRIYGVEKASQYYFNKHAKVLSYDEAAMLAGMVQMPNRYNPYRNPALTKKRQTVVLKAMYKNQYITKKELTEALNKPLANLVVKPKEIEKNPAYYEYIDQVLYELENKYHLDPIHDSLKVITYMDPKIQNKIYQIENNETLHPNDRTQTGIVVLETNTGIIRGIGGGREHHGALTFNFATNAKRQPGSTIKPILDYGPSIEYLRYSPAQPYLDDKIYYQTAGSRYMRVENYDNKYKGFVTMREAIIDSRNVTAIKAFREVGSKKAYEFANKLGISTDEPITEAHAIGGYQYGFTVLQMAGAYAPFGNGGIYNEPTTIDYVIKNNVKIKIPRLTHQAMRQDTAYLMSDILHSNMLLGTATRANVSDLIIAGKTGQTNYNYETKERYHFPSNSVRDSWFIGYTTKYTTAVWLGYDKIENGAFLTPVEARQSLAIFKTVMDKIHTNRTLSQPFKKPNDIIEVEVETHTSPLKLPNPYTPGMYRKKEQFIRGTEPHETSQFFKPLDKPKNFMVYFDAKKHSLNMTWNKETEDYTNDDFTFMESIHYIEDYFDNFKNRTQKEYYEAKNNFKPTFFQHKNIENIYEQYCQTQSEYCSRTTNQSLDFYLNLLENLKQYEINLMKKDKKVKILTEGEISNLRGYKVWNGYQDGLYSNLGNIEYQIYGNDGSKKTLLYQGPYKDAVHVSMSLKNFLKYDSFSIKADYTKYREKLQSEANLTLNPFFDFRSFIKKHNL